VLDAAIVRRDGSGAESVLVILIFLTCAVLVMMMFMLRNALAVVLASASANATWTATHDLPATCAAGLAALFLTSLLLELAANSRGPIIRNLSLTAESIVGGAAAATLAFMLFQGSQSAQALCLTMLCAALLGASSAFGNRANSTDPLSSRMNIFLARDAC